MNLAKPDGITLYQIEALNILDGQYISAVAHNDELRTLYYKKLS